MFEATTPLFTKSQDWLVDFGRFISIDDLGNWAKVCVIGVKIWKELFGGGNPIGQEIKINFQRFTIVGVMEEKGGSLATRGWDEMVLIPLTTVQRRFFNFPFVGVIFVQATSFETVEEALEEVRRVLKLRHENADLAFKCETAKDALRQIDKITLIIKGFLGGVASIALIVGGIGIMNIMLVSVVERT